ncbi:hypothetical protein PtB15_7B327 [Puccinia triticina]|nr:hypothetical protein PtB15_7B327 [Puccinia triticina]
MFSPEPSAFLGAVTALVKLHCPAHNLQAVSESRAPLQLLWDKAVWIETVKLIANLSPSFPGKICILQLPILIDW